MAGRDIALGGTIEGRFAGELFCAERDQVAPVTDQRMCRTLGLYQFAVGGEDGSGLLHIFEQTARAFGQRKIPAGALGRYHQYRRAVVREGDA